MLLAGHDPVQGPNTPDDARAFMVRQLAALAEVVQRTGIRLAALTRPTARWTDVPARVHARRAGFEPAKQAT